MDVTDEETYRNNVETYIGMHPQQTRLVDHRKVAAKAKAKSSSSKSSKDADARSSKLAHIVAIAMIYVHTYIRL